MGLMQYLENYCWEQPVYPQCQATFGWWHWLRSWTYWIPSANSFIHLHSSQDNNVSLHQTFYHYLVGTPAYDITKMLWQTYSVSFIDICVYVLLYAQYNVGEYHVSTEKPLNWTIELPELFLNDIFPKLLHSEWWNRGACDI